MDINFLFTLIIQTLAAFIGVYVTSIMVDAPKRTLFVSGLIGALGWGAYLLMRTSLSEALNVYLCSLGIAFAAQVVARVLKTPVTTILIPGFYALVPGVTLYRSLYFLIINDMENFNKYISLAGLTSGMIALGILTIDSFFNAMTRIQKINHINKQKREHGHADFVTDAPDWKNKKEI